MLLNEKSQDLGGFIDGKQIESTPSLPDGSHPTDCKCVCDEFTEEELPNETESTNTFDGLPEYVLSNSREFAITVKS
jgi:hypothetical protein